MSNKLVALMFGIGAAGWVYSQMMRRTGGNTKTSVYVAIGAGLIAAFIIFTLFTFIFPVPDDGAGETGI